PTLPYLLAATGYPGLLLVTLLFVWRFLASLESRAREPASDVIALGQPAGARTRATVAGRAGGAAGVGARGLRPRRSRTALPRSSRAAPPSTTARPGWPGSRCRSS